MNLSAGKSVEKEILKLTFRWMNLSLSKRSDQNNSKINDVWEMGLPMKRVFQPKQRGIHQAKSTSMLRKLLCPKTHVQYSTLIEGIHRWDGVILVFGSFLIFLSLGWWWNKLWSMRFLMISSGHVEDSWLPQNDSQTRLIDGYRLIQLSRCECHIFQRKQSWERVSVSLCMCWSSGRRSSVKTCLSLPS